MLMFCKNCGKEVDGNFCQHCGCPVSETILNETTQTQKRAHKAFHILSIITSVLCVLSLVSFFGSTLLNETSDVHISLILISFCLPFVMSVLLAAKIQPAKQGISVLLYFFSCAGLLFIGFVGLSYSLTVTALCALTVVFELVTAIFGQKIRTGAKLPVKRIVLTASIFILLSVVVLTVERITNYQHNARLSDVIINGVALTKEQLDYIDENYILRYSEHAELADGKLEDLNFEQSERQSDIVPGIEYRSTEIPDCEILQVESASLSVMKNLATSYSVRYSPVKITDENLKKVLEVYAVLLGDEFKCDDVSYTLDELLKNPLPQDGSVVYSNITSPKGGTHISLSLFVNQNGYAELDVMYLFPEAVEVQ